MYLTEQPAQIFPENRVPDSHHQCYNIKALFYATMSIYGLFLTFSASIITALALDRYRGRAPALTYKEAPNGINATERNERKAKAYDQEFKRYYQLHFHHFPKTTNCNVSSYSILMQKYITTNKNVMEHRGWWFKKKLPSKKGDFYIGLHKRGSLLDGKRVHAPDGLLTIARPQHCRDFECFFANAKETNSLIAIDDLLGPHRLEAVHIELPPEKNGHHVIQKYLHELNVCSAEILSHLQEQGRIAKSDSLHQTRTWDEQYELQQGTPYATSSNKALRKFGQVQQRLKDCSYSVIEAWRDPKLTGHRIGLMMLSSTFVSATLTFCAACLALLILQQNQRS